MSVRADKRNIPTLAEAVTRFIELGRTNHRSVREDISVLRGATRVRGRIAAGPALARSEFGGVRMDRIEAHDYARWFNLRHPDRLAPDTRKRGMSSLRRFLSYAVSQGWADDYVLAACQTIRPSPARRDWLHPEQVLALDDLIHSQAFDPYEQFLYDTLLMTGVRAEELVELRNSDLDRRQQILVIRRGKGGKRREIPIHPDYAALWEEHVRRYEITRGGFIFFSRRVRFSGGRLRETTWVIDLGHATGQKPARRVMQELQAIADDRLGSELAPSFPLTPHVLRRTFACLSLIAHALAGSQGGWDLRTLQQAMGHSSLEVTARYLADVEVYLRRHREPFSPISAARLAVSSGAAVLG